MPLQENDKVLLVIFGIMLLIPIAMVFLFVVFNRKKNKLLREQAEARMQFERELAESEVEIREETLRNISWELHDNIGQLITLAKVYLQNTENEPDKINESIDIIGNALNEVRALSRSINPESIRNMGLIDAINNEMCRFKRMKFIQTDFQINGEVIQLPNKEEIIIFRILQEFFSNTIKHSRATKMSLELEYNLDYLYIKCSDNGIGFDQNNEFNGIGLKNIKNRAKLINAKLEINSKMGEGTELKIKKKFK